MLMHSTFPDINLAELSSSDGLLAALRVLDALATHSDSSSDEGKELISRAAERALRALATSVTSMLPPSIGIAPKAEVFDSLAVLLDRLISTVVPLFSARSSRRQKKRARTTHYDKLDSFFGQLGSCVLVPLVRSFYSLSEAFLAGMLHPGSNERKASSSQQLLSRDVRPSVLNCIKVALDSLGHLCSSNSGDVHLLSCIGDTYDLVMLTATSTLR